MSNLLRQLILGALFITAGTAFSRERNGYKDPFWEEGNFEFGPFKDKPMQIEFYRAARIVAPEKVKELYGATVPKNYIALANVRGPHFSADPFLNTASHYIMLVPMADVIQTDYVSVSIYESTNKIRHSGFRFHFSKDVLSFPQIQAVEKSNHAPGSKKHLGQLKRTRTMFADTGPVDPGVAPFEDNKLQQERKTEDSSPTVKPSSGATLAEIRRMKAITRYAYTEDGFSTNETRYVPLELAKWEGNMMLSHWTNKANKTNYKEAYNLFTNSCFTDACGMLREVFQNRTKQGLVDKCRNMLSALPVGAANELVHLYTLGLIKKSASWMPLNRSR